MKILCSFFLALAALCAHAQSDSDLVAARVAQMTPLLANAHPRLLLRPADLPALREFLKTQLNQPEAAALAKLMLPPLDNPALIAEPRAVKNGTPENTKLWRAGYQAANSAAALAQRYALGWLLTQDPAYGREAARWLLHLASWSIDSNTYRSNDELFIQSLRPMIFAYDWAYEALTPEERATVGKALSARVDILASFIQPKFNLSQAGTPGNDLSHPMRFISTLGQGGLALYHETKNAPAWLAWSYEYYLRQFPVWGGPAGGWAEGLNYWATGISQHQRFLEGMAVLGFDAPLQRPFWRNTPYFGIYGQMPYPASSFGDLTNIMGPSESIALMEEKFAVLNGDPYPLAYARLLGQKRPTNFGYYTYDGIDAFLQAFRTDQARLPEVSLASLPQSRYFDDIGVVNMHSKLGDAAQDIMLGFRASPQGSASHGFSDQNSFVINAFGQPLAINSGYREFYGSDHHVGWSRQTKAKNAILFDGEGQRIRDASATGRITRYADGTAFTFASGDALPAYRPHATRALRHVFFVNRRYFVMLDELAAPDAIPYQWRLHARSQMALQPERNEIVQSQGDARLSVRFLLPAIGDLLFEQTDAFDPPVERSAQAKMPNEWHVSVQTKTRAKQQEFLSLLYPWSTTERRAPPASQSLPAAKGHALRLFGPKQEDLILIAREAEQHVEAAGWILKGMAASFSSQGDALHFALIETHSLSGPFALTAERPLSLEGTRTPQGISLQAQLHEPTTLSLTPGFTPKTVTGAESWHATPDGRVTLKLAAGPVLLTLKP